MLLYVICRGGSRTIGWLCEELVRRLARRKSATGAALDASQIILTRASDGAELFNEDTVTDILVDNEKVGAKCAHGHYCIALQKVNFTPRI